MVVTKLTEGGLTTRAARRSAAPAFYAACAERGIAVQHILYDAEDFDLLDRLVPPGLVDAPGLQLIFVLGRYSTGQQSAPRDLDPFLDRLAQRATPDDGADWPADWAACAFGRAETACLRTAHAAGGKLRVGFENNLLHDDGTQARDNAARVAAIRAIVAEQPTPT